jgi:hypothetical protein
MRTGAAGRTVLIAMAGLLELGWRGARDIAPATENTDKDRLR